jgi:putative hydrolase of the HAD superfamily
MPIKAILFDLDNTLVDFMKMKSMASKAAISAMIDAGLKVDSKKIEKTLWKLYERYGIEHQKIFQLLLQELTGKLDIKILAAGVIAYRKVKEAFLEPYPNVIPTLITLIKKGYRIGIITDAPRFQAWTRLCAMKLQHFFDIIIALEDTGKKKIEELPFRVAMKKLGLKPEEIMMIGDSIEKDILPAKKLGIKTVLARYGEYEKKDGKADFEIYDISELTKFL